jgi:High potential iron-sulfur protein
MPNSQDLTRRALLTAAAGAASALAIVNGARAGSIPQKSVKYQDMPKDGHQCSGCKLFIPGATADANGTCKSVAGDIVPHGWCVLFAPKES